MKTDKNSNFRPQTKTKKHRKLYPGKVIFFQDVLIVDRYMGQGRQGRQGIRAYARSEVVSGDTRIIDMANKTEHKTEHL